MNFEFFLTAALLGCGLAMDAFSMSLANGLSEPCMKPHRMCGMAGIFAFFQCAMPLIGWVCVHTVAERFEKFERFIPWIAFALLGYIGGKMLVEGLRGCECEQCGCCRVKLGTLLVQGVATSIDALSVGFTIAKYDFIPALVCCLVIAALTFVICTVGILLGKRFGTRLAGKATVFGGVLLIGIGLKILIEGLIA